jgi:uncharacterized protein YqiB (DUF1249 family)
MILIPSATPFPRLHDEPGTFAALMDLYECNYIHIRRLIPALPKTPTHLVSQAPGSLALHLQLVERFRYTTELILSYQFDEGGVTCAEPDLRIRVYHDARLAEVLTAQLRHWPAFDVELLASQHLDVPQLYWRWKINRFLFKWLSYCLRQGHRFSAITPPSPLPIGKYEA